MYKDFQTDPDLVNEFIFHYPDNMKLEWFHQYVHKYGKDYHTALVVFQNSLKVAIKHIALHADQDLVKSFKNKDITKITQRLKKINFDHSDQSFDKLISSYKLALAYNSKTRTYISETAQAILQYSLPDGYEPPPLPEVVVIPEEPDIAATVDHADESVADVTLETDLVAEKSAISLSSSHRSLTIKVTELKPFSPLQWFDPHSKKSSPDSMQRSSQSMESSVGEHKNEETMSVASNRSRLGNKDESEAQMLPIELKTESSSITFVARFKRWVTRKNSLKEKNINAGSGIKPNKQPQMANSEKKPLSKRFMR